MKPKPQAPRVKQLERENAQLRQELEKARYVIEVQKNLASHGADGLVGERREQLMEAVEELSKNVGVKLACESLSYAAPVFTAGASAVTGS